MTTLGEDEITSTVTTAAQQFVDAYYNALNDSRPTISSYYTSTTSLPSGRVLPTITYNGQQLPDPQAFQSTFQEQMPFTHFEVQSFNAHALNPAIEPLDPAGKVRTIKELKHNMSLVVQVSGYVRLVERKEGPMRGFSDNLVLVPNKEAAGTKGKSKAGEGRDWVIQVQNFRFIV